MRMSETNTVAPLVSPEKPPTASPAVVFFLPLLLSLTRGSALSAAVAEAGAQRGPLHFLGRASAVLGPPFLGPAQLWLCFVSLFRFALLFHRFVLIFKNRYFLVYRSKCYGSNFVEFLVLSSI